MEKYVVIKEKEINNAVIDQEVVCFFDSETEANQKAADVYYDLSEADKEQVMISVGLVDEANLEDPENWETYNEVEILYSFEKEN